MSILDELTGKLDRLFRGGTAGSGSLVHGVLDLINDPGHGGLVGLVQRFRQEGQGDVVDSWIGTGPNKPISPEQLTRVLGPDSVRRLGQSAGMTPESVGERLATMVPMLIDRLTPQGTMPPGVLLEGAIGLLKNKLAQL
jgi:uncharacterized protein YidB (DUF937 family)